MDKLFRDSVYLTITGFFKLDEYEAESNLISRLDSQRESQDKVEVETDTCCGVSSYGLLLYCQLSDSGPRGRLPMP